MSVGRAAGDDLSATERRRRMLDENRRAAAQVRDPAHVTAITTLLAMLVDARADLCRITAGPAKLRRRLKGTENRVRKLMLQLVIMRDTEATERRMLGDAAEPILRAKMRGEDVDAREAETADFALDEHGAKIRHKRGSKKGQAMLTYSTGLRAKKLTGVAHAFAKGYLDGGRGASHPERLHATAEQYGEAYEIDVGLRSGAGEGGGGYGPKGPQVKAVEAGEMLDKMREGMSSRERDVLDMVCGNQMRAREAATAMGAGFPATLRALRSGLRLAGDNWSRAQEEGTTGHHGARMLRAHQMMSRMRPQ